MRLWLVRHGTADPRDEDGADRPDRHLVEKGKVQLKHAAQLLKTLGVEFDFVLTSPYARAVESADILVNALALADRVEIHHRLTPEAPADAAIAAIAATRGRRVLVVGHEPQLSQIASLLCKTPQLCLDLRKGGMVELDVVWEASPQAHLVGVVRPAYLAQR